MGFRHLNVAQFLLKERPRTEVLRLSIPVPYKARRLLWLRQRRQSGGDGGGVTPAGEKNSLVCSILKRRETQPQITLAEP